MKKKIRERKSDAKKNDKKNIVAIVDGDLILFMIRGK